MNVNKENLRKSFKITLKSLSQMMMLFFGVLLLVSFVNSVITPEDFKLFFTGNIWLDSIKGSLVGSVVAGNPANSYIISNSLLENGIVLSAVVAFLISWVTVGFVNLPLESKYFGWKLAICRNIVNIVLSIIMGLLIYVIL